MNKFLLTKTSNFQFPPQFSPLTFLSQSPSIYGKKLNFLDTHRRKNCSYSSKIQTLCIASPSASLSYGGWDDPSLGGDSFLAGESAHHFQNFLNSHGINDKRYIFVYLLGFVCALGVAKIKVSSIVAVPACVIVFAVGFTVGYVNGAHLSFNGIKKRPKDEVSRSCDVKLRNLLDLLSSIDAKTVNLNDSIKKNIENSEVTLPDLEGLVRTVESINVSALDAVRIVEALAQSTLLEDKDVERHMNQTYSKRRKQGENVFDISRYISSIFQDKSAGSNPSKMKNLNKRESKDEVANDAKKLNHFAPPVKEQISNLLNQAGVDQKGSKPENLRIDSRTERVGAESENKSMSEMGGSPARAFGHKAFQYRSKRLLYMNNREVSLNVNYPDGDERWDSHDGSLDSMDFNVNLRHKRSEASIREEEEVSDVNRSYMLFDDVEDDETEINRSFVLEKGSAIPEGEPSPGSPETAKDTGHGASADKEFDKYVTEANILLKEAKQILLQQGKDRLVEDALYKSASLLSKATGIRPMSLLAVGQLGNTYLLHGELKLRISRELRAILAGEDYVSIEKWGLKELDDKFAAKKKLAPVLGSICEECEELLIKAGRNYRLALSIDGKDLRALYNWGLALHFRGQLVADIGPGAAHDADKIFLAAIDKFDAMLSKSNTYAPDALFRWGATLQHRSRLRPRNSKEKVKLLQQARRLYEDALDMNSNNIQVKHALSSCISEIKFWYN